MKNAFLHPVDFGQAISFLFSPEAQSSEQDLSGVAVCEVNFLVTGFSAKSVSLHRLFLWVEITPVCLHLFLIYSLVWRVHS